MQMNRLVALCLLFILAAEAQLRAEQKESFSFGGPPAWVDVLDAPVFRSEKTNQASDGISFALLDEQVNVGTAEHYTRTVRDLVSENGVQNGAQLDVDFDPSYQHLVFHHLRVYRGTNVLDRLRPHAIKTIQQERELDRFLYNGKHTAIIFTEDVRVGDRVDFAYTLRGNNPIFEGKYLDSFFMQWAVALQQTRFRLLVPDTRKVNYTNHGEVGAPDIKNLQNLTEYIWKAEDIAPVSYEDDVPTWFERYSWVQLTEFTSWEDVARWAVKLYPTDQTLPEELKGRIREWKKLNSTEEQARAALQMVQDEIRYLGFELGISSHNPATPETVYLRRFGDCKDKSYLLCAILQEMEIEAYPVLVNSSLAGHVQNWAPSPYAFNHVIVQLRLNGMPYWVDPTIGLQRGAIPRRFQGDYQRFLPVRPSATSLEIMPFSGAGLPKTAVKEAFRVGGKKEPTTFTVNTMFEGAAADSVRARFAGQNLEEFEKSYLNFHARQYPKIKASSPLRIQDNETENRFEMFESYEVEEIWAYNEEEKQYTCEFYPWTLRNSLNIPDTKIRSAPIRIQYPHSKTLRTEVQLPEDWPVDPKRQQFKTGATSFSHVRELKGSRLVMEYKYETSTNFVSTTNISQYLKWVDQVRDALGYTLYWGNEEAPAKSQLNWPIMAFAGCFLTLASGGAVGLTRWRRRTPMSSLPEPPVIDNLLQGLSGWLVLVGFGLLLRPLVIVGTLIQVAPSYELTTWQTLTSPAGAAYHTLWAPLLIFELTANLTMFVFSFLLLYLFFKKRRSFPTVYSVFLLFSVAVMLVDYIGGSFIPAVKGDHDSLRDLMRAVVGCMIWVPYMQLSKRVKATFVR